MNYISINLYLSVLFFALTALNAVQDSINTKNVSILGLINDNQALVKVLKNNPSRQLLNQISQTILSEQEIIKVHTLVTIAIFKPEMTPALEKSTILAQQIKIIKQYLSDEKFSHKIHYLFENYNVELNNVTVIHKIIVKDKQNRVAAQIQYSMRGHYICHLKVEHSCQKQGIGTLLFHLAIINLKYCMKNEPNAWAYWHAIPLNSTIDKKQLINFYKKLGGRISWWNYIRWLYCDDRTVMYYQLT